MYKEGDALNDKAAECKLRKKKKKERKRRRIRRRKRERNLRGKR